MKPFSEDVFVLIFTYLDFKSFFEFFKSTFYEVKESEGNSNVEYDNSDGTYVDTAYSNDKD